MIFKTNYKDRPAIGISGKTLTALFLPEDGAKLASLKTSEGVELLEQAPGKEYSRLTIDGSYVASECSGFDDMFPTIDECEMREGQFYPDHGEVCRKPHECSICNDAVSFICYSESANAIFSKKIYIGDSALYIKYCIQNLNTYTLPYIWAGHMMFAGRRGSYVFTNYPDTAEKRIMFGNPPDIDTMNVLGEFKPYNENIPAGGSYKYYYTEPKAPILCGIHYGNSDETVTVSFTGDTVRCLGIWINNGGFKGMYNIALEPCTAPYDSPVNAIASGNASFIPPESSVEFIMKIHYELEIIC